MFFVLGSVELDLLDKSCMMGKLFENAQPVVAYIYPRRSRTECEYAYSDSKAKIVASVDVRYGDPT